MAKKVPVEGALFVRLPTAAVDKLDRAAERLGVRKKDLVAGLVSKYVDPDSPRGLTALGTTLGTYSFQAYEPEPLPEVLNAEQAGQLLQTDEATVISMAEAGHLPGRKLGAAWRFSRAALVAWLSTPEVRL
jgi:excisionase family DNA binding protein